MSSSNLYITQDTELSDIVRAYPGSMLFLEHFDIHVPFQTKTVDKICSEHNISSDLFIAFANLYLGKDSYQIPKLRFSDLPAIIRYLHNNHKYYLDEIYPKIQQCIKLIMGLNDLDESKLVEKFFQDYFNEVREHLNYENSVVFPFVTGLYDVFINKIPYRQRNAYSVSEYKDHHSDIEEKLDDLMSLLIKYLPHKNDQQARRELFHLLVELDYDLKVHARIEDLILVPLVEKLEKQLNAKP
ncbi:MAG TPA: hypothetical protein PK252_02255 [Bacteroidales bacterium]|nr:hypothetical protein [Bacteroidales bacterium]